MPLKGGLRDFSLPDLFQLMHFGKKNGTLVITNGDAKGYVCFRNGNVFFATHNWKRAPFGQRLVEAGMVSDDQVEEALDLQKSTRKDQRLGNILVELGYLSRESLEVFVEEQIRDAVFNLLRWSEGDFDFDPDQIFPEEDTGLSMSTEDLIMEGSRRMDEWYQIEKKVPSLDAVFKNVEIPKKEANELNLASEERLVLYHVDGESTVRDIIEKSGQSALATCKALYGLVTAGLVELAGTPSEVVLGSAGLGDEIDQLEHEAALEIPTDVKVSEDSDVLALDSVYESIVVEPEKAADKAEADDRRARKRGRSRKKKPVEEEIITLEDGQDEVITVEEVLVEAGEKEEAKVPSRCVRRRGKAASTEPPQEAAVAEHEKEPAAHAARDEVDEATEDTVAEAEEPETAIEPEQPSTEVVEAGGSRAAAKEDAPAPGQSLVNYYKSLALKDLAGSDVFRETEEKREFIEREEELAGDLHDDGNGSSGTGVVAETVPEADAGEPEDIPMEWAGHLTRMRVRGQTPVRGRTTGSLEADVLAEDADASVVEEEDFEEIADEAAVDAEAIADDTDAEAELDVEDVIEEELVEDTAVETEVEDEAVPDEPVLEDALTEHAVVEEVPEDIFAEESVAVQDEAAVAEEEAAVVEEEQAVFEEETAVVAKEPVSEEEGASVVEEELEADVAGQQSYMEGAPGEVFDEDIAVSAEPPDETVDEATSGFEVIVAGDELEAEATIEQVDRVQEPALEGDTVLGKEPAIEEELTLKEEPALDVETLLEEEAPDADEPEAEALIEPPETGEPDPAEGRLGEVAEATEVPLVDEAAVVDEGLPSEEEIEKLLQVTPPERGELSREEMLAFDQPTYAIVEPRDAAPTAAPEESQEPAAGPQDDMVADLTLNDEAGVTGVESEQPETVSEADVQADVAADEFVLDETATSAASEPSPDAGFGPMGQVIQFSKAVEVVLEQPEPVVKSITIDKVPIAEDLHVPVMDATAGQATPELDVAELGLAADPQEIVYERIPLVLDEAQAAEEAPAPQEEHVQAETETALEIVGLDEPSAEVIPLDTVRALSVAEELDVAVVEPEITDEISPAREPVDEAVLDAEAIVEEAEAEAVPGALSDEQSDVNAVETVKLPEAETTAEPQLETVEETALDAEALIEESGAEALAAKLEVSEPRQDLVDETVLDTEATAEIVETEEVLIDSSTTVEEMAAWGEPETETAEVEEQPLTDETAGLEPALDFEHAQDLRDISSAESQVVEPEPQYEEESLQGEDPAEAKAQATQYVFDTEEDDEDAGLLGSLKVSGKRGAGTSLVDLETFELEQEFLELVGGVQQKKRIPLDEKTKQQPEKTRKEKKGRGGRSRGKEVDTGSVKKIIDDLKQK